MYFIKNHLRLEKYTVNTNIQSFSVENYKLGHFDQSERRNSNNKGIYDDNLHNVGRNQISDFYAFVGNFKMQNCVKYSIYSKYNIFNDI